MATAAARSAARARRKLGSRGNGGSGLTLVPTAPGFLGPKSWTGTVTTNPALTGALGNLADLLANGNTPPRFLIPIYMEAGRRYHVPWQVLAAINAVESDFGRNLNTSSAGAIGWMQFEPSTWKQYGLAVDGHSVPNPYDPRDAIFSAARYLAAAGAAQDVSRAIFAYNHATWYVNMVLTRARAIAAGVHPHTRTEQARCRLGLLRLLARALARPVQGRRAVALRPPDRRRQHGQRRQLPLCLRRRPRAAGSLRAV